MGLFSIIKKQKLKDKEIRCLILGLDNSGKSTIVNKILPEGERAKNNEITPTIGFQIQSIEISNHLITIWDIGGQNTLRPFWDNYFDKTDVLIWCIDSNVAIRFDESINELKNLIERDSDRIGYDCPIIVVLNKIDLLRSDSISEQKAVDKISKLSQEIKTVLKIDENNTKYKFIQSSAITGEGIQDITKYILQSSYY